MPVSPVKLSLRAIDRAEAEKLRGHHDLLDAAEMIANIGNCQWDYHQNRLISCSEGYARIFNMSVAEAIEQQSDWEKSLAQIHPDDRQVFE